MGFQRDLQDPATQLVGGDHRLTRRGDEPARTGARVAWATSAADPRMAHRGPQRPQPAVTGSRRAGGSGGARDWMLETSGSRPVQGELFADPVPDPWAGESQLGVWADAADQDHEPAQFRDLIGAGRAGLDVEAVVVGADLLTQGEQAQQLGISVHREAPPVARAAPGDCHSGGS